MMDKIVECTNEYAEAHPMPAEDARNGQASWMAANIPRGIVCIPGELIHIGIADGSAIKNYSGNLEPDSCSHRVKILIL